MNQQIYIFHTLLQQVTQLTQLFQMHPFCNVFMVFWCFQGVEEACIGNEWVKSSNSCNYSFSFINSFTCPCNNSIFSFLLQISSLIWLLDVSLKYSKYFFYIYSFSEESDLCRSSFSEFKALISFTFPFIVFFLSTSFAFNF